MLIDNINYMVKHHRHVHQLMKKYENQGSNDSSVEISQTKNGLPTIKLIHNGNSLFIHSKYDPVKESERILSKYENKILERKNILFYGVGLGYHVELFMRKYPEKNYYLYEPNPEIFYALMKSRDISKIVGKTKHSFLIQENEMKTKEMLIGLPKQLTEDFLLIAHPSYERIYKEKLQEFMLEFKHMLKNKKVNIMVNIAFQKRWTLNCVKNLKYTINTPNILSDQESNPFRGKPAIIVAAGPSLIEELDHLRQIKKEGTAYILTVGSANKVLIKNGIEPDAVCTYDPQGHNHKVFEEMIEKDVTHIPMIYGTTVGFETLDKYKGPKLHMVTSHDFITPYFITNPDNGLIEDAPSIAVITLQMLNKLGASPIILTGQNLAYRHEEYYAKGIEYENRKHNLTDRDKTQQITVKSVEGEGIQTNEGFYIMKESFEHFLSKWKRSDIINTTVGGADITGAPFMLLETVINQYLTKQVVEANWVEEFMTGNWEKDAPLKLEKLREAYLIHIQTMNELSKLIEEIKVNLNIEHKLEKLYNKLDKKIKKLANNDYYKLFINSIMHLERAQIERASREIKYMKNGTEKAQKIIEHFGNFINAVVVNSTYMESAYLELEKNWGCCEDGFRR